MNCPTCNNHRYRLTEGENNALAVMCTACVCHDCEDELFTFERDALGQWYSTPCGTCGPIRSRVRHYQKAGVPRRYVDATFSGFKASTASQKGALAWFHARVGGWQPSDRALVLSGSVGTGKTHLMAAWIRTLCLQREIECKFLEFSHLLSDLKAGFDEGHSEARIISQHIDTPVLVIDELGKSLKTEWQMSVLDSLISRRYERGVATFATTNYPFELGFGNGASRSTDDFARKTLGDVTGDRIASRLSEMCDFLTINAPDYRRSLRGPAMGVRV